MSWLCGGKGVSNQGTLQAGHKALTQHQWDRGKKLLDRAWQDGPEGQRAVVDTCEQAVAHMHDSYQALGREPPELVATWAAEETPDKKTVDRFNEEKAARLKAHGGEVRATRAKLNHLHYLAKHYNKRLLVGVKDPAEIGTIATRVAAHHQELSKIAPRGYDSKHNQRAYDYYTHAIEAFDEAHMPAPNSIVERMTVVSDRLLHTQRWYNRNKKKLQLEGNGRLFEDFVTLMQTPADVEARHQNLKLLSSLLGESIPEASHTFILEQVIQPLTQWLLDPSEEAQALRVSVLQVFSQAINHQPWLKQEAGAALRQFVQATDVPLHFEHVKELYHCYKGLIDKNGKFGRVDVLPDLDILRVRMAHHEQALAQVVTLLDDVLTWGSKKSTDPAANMLRTIGMESSFPGIQRTVLENFEHLALFRGNDYAPMALEAMAAVIATMKDAQLREYGIVRLAMHNIHAARLEAANHALYTTLGLQHSYVESLLRNYKASYQYVAQMQTHAETAEL